MKTRLLRNLSIILLAVVMVMGITSCGKDGKDGKPYIKIDLNDGTLLSYSHDIPNVPDTVVEETYYESEAGAWTFTYVHADNPGNQWVAAVEMEDCPDGEPGELFSNGSDGDNLYYELTTFAFLGPRLLRNDDPDALKIADVGVCEKRPTQRIVHNGWIITINVDCQEL